MNSAVLILLIFAGLFLVIDIAIFVRMIFLVKKYQGDTVENLGNKLNPYLYANGAVSVLMAIFLILSIIMK